MRDAASMTSTGRLIWSAAAVVLVAARPASGAGSILGRAACDTQRLYADIAKDLGKGVAKATAR